MTASRAARTRCSRRNNGSKQQASRRADAGRIEERNDMCRWLAYFGEPVFLEDFVSKPCQSLIAQSRHCREAKSGFNADGFGIGWYGERERPGLFRDVRPAWSDENLLSIAHPIRSTLFLAHVRAATGTATIRTNCHPFAADRYLFMHNGQIGGWPRVRRVLESHIPDS